MIPWWPKIRTLRGPPVPIYLTLIQKNDLEIDYDHDAGLKMEI